MESVIVIPYQWILENVEREPKTLSSEMILFRGEKVFRVGLKNQDVLFAGYPSRKSSPLLFLMAVNLHKLGMRVREVVFVSNKHNNQLVTMTSNKTNNYRDENLQLFKADLDNMVFGKCTFTFRILIEGSVAGYSYKCSDRRLPYQLWEGVTKMKHFTDLALIVKDKKFFVHKAILAARSPFFQAKFAVEREIYQVIIEDVEPLIMEQFLQFLYTGQTCKTLANKQLLQLAVHYQLETLVKLCESALIKIDVEQTARCLTDQRQDDYPISALVITPLKDTEMYFDPNTFSLLFDWNLGMPAPNEHTDTIASQAFEYHNEKLFSARIEGNWNDQRNFSGKHTIVDDFVGLQSTTIRLICSNQRNIGCTIKSEVFCSLKCDQQPDKHIQRIQMKREDVINQELILVYWAPILANLKCSNSYTISFWITMASKNDKYSHELRDSTWPTQLWSAARQRHLTDIEISVGPDKKLYAHRCVLSARSSILATLLTDKNKTTIAIEKRFDFGTVCGFFEFLYTGILTIPADDKQLFELAEMYQVETLRKICQAASNISDVDEITKSLLAVI